jgi:hypothetical protein
MLRHAHAAAPDASATHPTSCSGAGGITDVASAATVTRRVLSARFDMTALARGLKRTSLPRAMLAR